MTSAMAVYAIALITITDREEYGKYEAAFLDVFAKHPGELLAVDEAPRVAEGEWSCTRTVLLRFPDHASLERWYASDDYQRIVQHRWKGATANVAIVQGIG
jgi:uncharacterized protein (DUF1330 family)